MWSFYYGCVFRIYTENTELIAKCSPDALQLCFFCFILNDRGEKYFNMLEDIKCHRPICFLEILIFTLKGGHFTLSKKETNLCMLTLEHTCNSAFNLVDTFEKYLISLIERTVFQCLDDGTVCHCCVRNKILHCMVSNGRCRTAKEHTGVSVVHCTSTRNYGFNPALAKPS